MEIIDRYFLPTKTRSVHAASMAFYKDHPIFSWFGGTKEGAGDVSIYLYNLNGEKDTITIGDNDIIPRWNPVLVNVKEKLFLFTKSGMFCDRWQTFVHNISNWTVGITNKEIVATASCLPAGLNGPVKTKPIIIRDVMYCGSSVETMYDWASYIESYDIAYSDLSYLGRSNPMSLSEKKTYIDHGGVTKKTLGIIQPTLWYDEKNDKMKAFFRSSKGLGWIYYSETHDEDYMLWSDEPEPTNLQNPNSGIDIVCCKNELYLAHNPSDKFRYPLVVSKIVQDEKDKTIFNTIDTLEIRDNVSENNPFITQELSYPYMVERDGMLHLLYTYGRAMIEYVVVKI
jgi:predicted neuraminidase